MSSCKNHPIFVLKRQEVWLHLLRVLFSVSLLRPKVFLFPGPYLRCLGTWFWVLLFLLQVIFKNQKSEFLLFTPFLTQTNRRPRSAVATVSQNISAYLLETVTSLCFCSRSHTLLYYSPRIGLCCHWPWPLCPRSPGPALGWPLLWRQLPPHTPTLREKYSFLLLDRTWFSPSF